MVDRRSRLRLTLGGLALLAGFACAAGTAFAHPISISQENVFVERDKVTVTMEIFAEDLYFFHDVRPDDTNVVAHEDLMQAAKQHEAFLLERISVVDVDGNKLDGRIAKVDTSALMPPGTAVPELQYVKLSYTMEYPLEQPPEFLTFSQNMIGLDIGFPSVVQLNVKQAGTPFEKSTTLKPGQPHTVRFDWQDAPASNEATKQELEAWLEEQKEKTLGITDFNSAYSFVYVEDRAVRHEILMPFPILESFFLIDRDRRAYLEVDEQQKARKQIGEFFAEANPVEIDGIEVQPIVKQVGFYEVDFGDFGSTREAGRVNTTNAMVTVILVYPAKQPPEHVKVTWDQFNRRLAEVESIAFAGDERFRPVFSRIERQDTWEWTSPGRPDVPPIDSVSAAVEPPPVWRIPVVTAACVVLAVFVAGLALVAKKGTALFVVAAAALLGAGVGSWRTARIEIPAPFSEVPDVSEKTAAEVFQTLHANTYRAFDYHTESDVYDALAESIDGDLLEETYLRIQKSLEMQEQGGAVSQVDEVTILEGEKEPLPPEERRENPGFQFRTTWTVTGTVEHWGHLHSRTNQYEGLFTIRARDDAWKITDLEILDEERVGLQTRLRKF